MLTSLPFIKQFYARPRLAISIFSGFILFFAFSGRLYFATRYLIAWDGGAAIYLVLVARMMTQSSSERISRRAIIEDEGKILILILNIIATISSIAAIIMVLSSAKSLSRSLELQHIFLTAVTIIISWFFVHTIFALHYANEYYMDYKGTHKKGLVFPGDAAPNYWDFIYFSFIIGAAAQTADVSISAKDIRRTATVHCVFALFFNTVILALTINIGAGLLD